jgi:hypothetical protein
LFGEALFFEHYTDRRDRERVDAMLSRILSTFRMRAVELRTMSNGRMSAPCHPTQRQRL